MTVLTCSFCGERIFTSKQNYRTTNVQVNGIWTQLAAHTRCDPFTVSTVVTPKVRRDADGSDAVQGDTGAAAGSSQRPGETP